MTAWLWVGFLALVVLLLALDLYVLNREAHVISIRESLLWTGFWVFVALVFNVFVYYIYQHDWLGIAGASNRASAGHRAALEFLTGYLVEKSLSLDNIFVMALIFGYFAVPREYQHLTLFYGILGAIVLRGVMIVAGAALISRFEWMIQVFGVVLLITALKMALAKAEEVEPEKNPLVKLARRFYPVSGIYHGQRFFTTVDGRRVMTPLFLALLCIESADVMFAVDSIPAIFGVTRDPFIVFTSNIFAILGLRALYFALAGMLARFRYMKASLFIVLIYIGVKMLIQEVVHIEPGISLLVIVATLIVGVLASLIAPRDRGQELPASPEAEAEPADRAV